MEHTCFTDGSYKNPLPMRLHKGTLELRRGKVDFGYKTLDAGNGDVATALLLPKECWILNAWVRVLNKCPTNSTIDLGYGSDVDCWGQALPIDSTGAVDQQRVAEESGQTMIYQNRAPIAASPRFFATSDTIDVKATVDTADVDISSGIIEVCALILKQE